MPDWFGPVSAAAEQGDPTSTLEFYRAAIALRRNLLTTDESLTFLDAPDDVIAIRRGSGIECWLNVGTVEVELPAGEVLLSSIAGDRPTGRLAPDEAVLLRR